MKNSSLIFSFSDSNKTFEFNDGFSFVKNRRLFDTLKLENYKNSDSLLVFKSLNNVKISDTFQIKINIKQIGYFLVNFLCEENSKNEYLSLIKEIESLKDDAVLEEMQLLKIEKVILILNKYHPIYSIFIGREDTFLYLKECNKVVPSFPLLFPQIVEEVEVEVVEKRVQENKKLNFNWLRKLSFLTNIEKPFFTLDFLFDLVFSFFLTFALYSTCAFFYKDDLKGLLFLFQIFFYLICLIYNLYLSKYKGKRKEQKGATIIAYCYILLGVAIANLASFYFVGYALKMSDVPLLALPIILSFVLCLASLPILTLVLKLIKKR